MMKKILVPVLISLVFIGFWGFLMFLIWQEAVDWIGKIFMTIPFAGAIGCMIHVLIQRIREIQGGNEDDLDHY